MYAELLLPAVFYITIRKSKMMPSNRLLRADTYALGQPLCKLFNDRIKQGKFPAVWKHANIKPVPKSNHATKVKDYRPVVQTSIIAKTFELLLLRLVKVGLHDNNQFAYQSRRSAEDALTLYQHISMQKPRTMHLICL